MKNIDHEKTIVLYFTIFFAINNNALAQTYSVEGAAKNAIYLNVGGTILYYNSVSLNYDVIIKQSEKGFFKNYYLSFEAGFFNLNSGFAPAPNSIGVLGSTGLTGLTGKNRKHFEVGLGILLNFETDITNTETGDDMQTEVFVLPDLAIGYRYHNENGFLFRTGIGFPQGFYFSLGYGF